MAHLTGGNPSTTGSPGDSESRGQLLLVSGFALAVLLLTLAVALNAATYTESLATRSDGIEAGDVATVQYGVERGVDDLIRATNAQQPDASDREALFASNLGNWSAFADRQAAADATAVDVTLVGTTNGMRVWQNDSSRAFTSANGNATWTLAENVTDTRGFEMTVSREALANDTCPSGCFTVVAANETATWEMTVTGNATNVTVSVDGPTDNRSCSVRANETTIELSAGRLAGDPCPALTFDEALAGDYDITYEHGDEANGTYAFVVENDDLGVETTLLYGSPPGPHAHPAVWSAAVELTYRTPTAEYSRTIQVTPGDDDD